MGDWGMGNSTSSTGGRTWRPAQDTEPPKKKSVGLIDMYNDIGSASDCSVRGGGSRSRDRSRTASPISPPRGITLVARAKLGESPAHLRKRKRRSDAVDPARPPPPKARPVPQK